MLNDNQIPLEWKNFEHIYEIIPNFSTTNDSFSGLLLFIKKSIEIINISIIVPGRVILVKTKHENNPFHTNYLSIYGKASGSQSDRLGIFEKILQQNWDTNEVNVLIGDYNFVSSVLDRNTNLLNPNDQSCKTLWNDIETRLNLVDCFRVTNKVRRLYTYSSPSHSKSRIDRIYISTSMSGKIVSTSFENTDVSDHKIVITKFKQQVIKGPGCYIINTSLLDDDYFVQGVRDIIYDFSDSYELYNSYRILWDFLKMAIVDFARNYSIRKAKERNARYNQAIKRIEILESMPKSSLTAHHIQEINENKNIEIQYLSYKIKGALLRAKLANFDENEVNISYLSRLEKIRRDSNTIAFLTDDEGILREGTEQVISVVNNFYSNLYDREIEDVNEQNFFFRNVSRRVSFDDKMKIDNAIPKEELFESLCDIKNNKSPGEDSISKEVLFYFWDELSPLYLKCIQEIKEMKELSESQKCALITLVYKKGDRNMIKNYRPISLLNVDLKIITRTLAKRMLIVLDKLISKNQKCLPGRHIEINTHILQDLIDFVNSSGLEAAMLFLDQEKAFDRMSHSFIFKTLRHFGFGNEFIDWIKIIYTDCSAKVKVNGHLSSSVPIKRGVRQGCPLSALLYVLCIEVLSLEFQNNQRILGFKFHTYEHKDTVYADDISITVTDIASIDEIFNVLGKYEKATNAKINVDKTEGLWIGNWRSRLDKPKDINWVNTMVMSLGIYVGNNRSEVEMRGFEEAKEKIKTKLNFWNGKGISLKGKIRVINMFIHQKLWYTCEIHDMPVIIKREIKRLITGFIWGDSYHQRSLEGMEADYGEGGLRLGNIDKRMNAIRIKWLRYLVNLNESYFEYFLANKLTSKNYSKMGLDLLKGYTGKYVNTIKHKFYKNAIQAWYKLNIQFMPKNSASIKNLWIYENILLQHDDGRVYKPPAHSSFVRRRRDMPYYFKDLPFPIVNRHHVDASLIRNINNSFANIVWSNEDFFFIVINGENKNIQCLSFKDLYWLQFHHVSNQPFKVRWGYILPNYSFNWELIWSNVHCNMLSYKTQSSLWMMTNLNFISSYSLNRMYNVANVCVHCEQPEEGFSHCFVFCDVSNLVYCHFLTTMRQLVDVDITMEEKAFGLPISTNREKRKQLRNYINACIKCVIFRNRGSKLNGNSNIKSLILISKCRKALSMDLTQKFLNYKNRKRLDKFREMFLIENILGLIDSNGFHFTRNI